MSVSSREANQSSPSELAVCKRPCQVQSIFPSWCRRAPNHDNRLTALTCDCTISNARHTAGTSKARVYLVDLHNSIKGGEDGEERKHCAILGHLARDRDVNHAPTSPFRGKRQEAMSRYGVVVINQSFRQTSRTLTPSRQVVSFVIVVSRPIAAMLQPHWLLISHYSKAICFSSRKALQLNSDQPADMILPIIPSRGQVSHASSQVWAHCPSSSLVR